MIETLISYLSNLVNQSGYFEQVYCLAEYVKKEDKRFPAVYHSKGNYTEIKYDQLNGVAYFIKNGDISVSNIESQSIVGKPSLNIAVPLKLVCLVNKSAVTDNQYTDDLIAQTLIKALTGVNTSLKTAIKANKVNVLAKGYKTNKEAILNDEFDEVKLNVRYNYSYISIEVEANIIINADCIPSDCEFTYPTFPPNPISPRLTCETLPDCEVIQNHEQRIEALEQGGTGLTCETLEDCQVIIDIETSISNEVTARESADETLQNNIDLKQDALGFTPENVSNKSTDVDTDKTSNTKYPTVKAVYDWAVSVFTTASAVATQISTALVGYATQSWVTTQGYLTSITGTQVTNALGYTPENAANKGQNNGYAALDSGGKVPLSNLPSTLLVYKGVWNASTNTPTLTNNDITKAGYVYNVGTAGTQFSINWSLGDWLIYNDLGVIEKSDNSDDVVSVNGQQGTVVLNATDVDALKRDGSNANSDVDLGTYGLNAKQFHVKGTGGAGHIGFKHQSANITANANESSLGADSSGNPQWKNDGNAVDSLELQSNKSSSYTASSTTTYANTKALVDGLATKQNTLTNPITGTGTTNEIAYFSGATALASLPTATYPNLTELSYVKGVTSAIQTQINNKVTANGAITGATKTKITYDSKGLVTSGADATTADIADSTNKRYVTDAQLVVIGNTSGVNTGDQTLTGTYKSLHLSTTLTSGNTYFFGALSAAASTTAANRRVFLGFAHTITAVSGFISSTSASGNNTLYIRVNNTTDYLVSNTFNINANQFSFNITGLSIAIGASDYWEFKLVMGVTVSAAVAEYNARYTL